MEYPHNLLNDIGIDVEQLPPDFYPTLHYILQTIADKRDARIILLRYRDGRSFEDIGEEFGLSRQRVSVITADLVRELSTVENKEKLKYGMTAYMEHAVNSRIEQLGSLLMETEKKEIIKEAYARGYENGKKDAMTGRADNRADLESVRAIPVNSLPFSVRSFNCFVRNNINYLGDVIDMGDTLKDIQWFGKTCFKEVIDTLKKYDVDVKAIYPRTIMKFEVEV